jgi:6-phosphogluconolactonase (cycloisomerase 2 family)
MRLAIALALVLASACSIPGDRFFGPGGGDGGGSDTGNDGPPGGKLRHGYFVDESASGGIFQIAKDDSGRLSFANGNPTQTGLPLFAITSKDGAHLYVLDAQDPPSLHQFQIASDGTLTPQSMLGLPCKAAFAALHPSGNFLAFTCAGQVGVVNLPMQQVQILNAGNIPNLAAFTPNGDCLLVSDSNGTSAASVLRFTMNQVTGQIALTGTAQGVAPSTGIAIHPNGQFAYASSNNQPMVQIYQVGASCSLNVRGTQSIGIPTTSILIDPTGTFLYVTGMQVFAFSIRADGTLTPAPNSPFFSGQFTLDATVDPAQPDSLYLTTNGAVFQAIVDNNGSLAMGSRVDLGGGGGRGFELAP